jgi:pilus assembly protein CpaE
MRPIILVGTTEPFARRVQAALTAELREQLRLWPHQVAEPGGLDAILDADPAVLIIGPGLVDEVSLRLAQQVDARRTDVGVVVVQASENQSVDDALAAGVRGILHKNSEDDAIRQAVTRAVAAAERHQQTKASAAVAAELSASKGKVTTVLSPKGGAGKTVLSTNLAVGLASTSPRGVVIVDLDLQFGDVAYALGLKPRHTIFDAVSTASELDITTLKVYLTHHSSDLYVLCAPDEPERGEMISVEMVQRVISLLAADFDHVVVDTGAGLGEHTLAALDLSTDLIFLADMDVPSVRHLTKVVRVLDRLDMRTAERHFVLNRADARVGLSMAQVATQAGLSIDLKIPTSKQVPVTLNQGVPVLLDSSKNPVTKKVWELVERLTGPQVRESRPPLKWSA